MNKLMQALSLVSFMGCLSSAQAADLNMEPGMWKWISTLEIEGMELPIPPVTYSSCITKQDLIPKKPEDDQGCKNIDQKITDNSVQWKMECNEDGDITVAEGKISYSGTSAKGNIQVTTKGMKMITKLKGERTGACE